MANERMDEDAARIVNCVNNCWPEYPFTYNDLRKPTGEKFRDILLRFIKGMLGGNYQLPSVNTHEFTKNPEMYTHMEGNLSLFKDINSLLKRLHCMNLRYVDLIRPAPSVVREVLMCLVNFLAYFEGEEAGKEDIEAEVQSLKNRAVQNEKRLIEEDRYLNKCKQSDEEKKILGTELRELLLTKKEQYLKIEGSVSKLETEIEAASKRVHSLNLNLQQVTDSLKQIELEKEKAAEAVVPDPDALEAELYKSQNDKDAMETSLACLKSRLPILEQQIADRTMQLQEQKETHQRLAQVKSRESKIKVEWQKLESECWRIEDEKDALDNQLKKDSNLVESKRRMLEEYNMKVEQLRASLEKARSDLKHCMGEQDSRRALHESRILALENEIKQLKQDLQLGQKVLDEGTGIFEAIQAKHQREVQQLYARHADTYEAVQNLLTTTYRD